MWLFSPEFPTRGPQDEKIKNRSCRNKAADSEGGRRPVPTRGNRRGERADVMANRPFATVRIDGDHHILKLQSADI